MTEVPPIVMVIAKAIDPNAFSAQGGALATWRRQDAIGTARRVRQAIHEYQQQSHRVDGPEDAA